MTNHPSEPISPGAQLDAERRLLRHMAATLAYRSAKVLRDAPRDFPTFTASPGRRPPVTIVAHLGDLMAWAVCLANGEYKWSADGGDDWDREVARFYERLSALDGRLADAAPLGYPPEILIQGPLADALTHVGQLSMLRGMFGAPVRPESYARAQITVGRVGMDQPPPGREFDGDASIRK